MLPHTTVNRRTLLTLVCGVTFGWFGTYIVLKTSQNPDVPPQPLSGPQHFIPQSPHSNGETDNFVGPDIEQTWNDFHAENHQGN